ncbi:substrate-binding domain-containing protein [Streptomyces sp. NPDC020996]|uniref:PstS family phosphate ABC transporter substrate-binding protein n=1 Tax=Streptomyces sp. NPDC020996 TaxID=3154791 RepID=UPI0033C7D901
MNGTFDFDRWVAVVSIALPLGAFLWEFTVVGRKRLGYRVQMDTLATDASQSPYAGVLRDMRQDGHLLKDPSFVLLRIENAGSAPIGESDYLTPDSDPCGIRVTFQDRQVASLVVTELSQDDLHDSFLRDGEAVPGFGYDNHVAQRTGVIRLPKVKLPQRAEYKVLVVLERWPGDTGSEPFPEPVFRGAVGRRRRWFDPLARFFRFKTVRTESHVFASRPAWVGITLLALAVLAQSITLIVPDDRAPLDCVGGTLHLHGSSAFGPAVREAAARYEEACKGKGVSIPVADGTFGGSGQGVTELEAAGRDAGVEVGEGLGDHITFTDGTISGHPRLLNRAIAYSAYTLVVNKDAGVENLTTPQIRDLFAGKVTNWSQLNGNHVPVHLVNRSLGSGTRNALADRVLGGKEPLQGTVRDCAELPADGYGRCETGDTRSLLDAVAREPGGLGYSELRGADNARKTESSLIKVRIDNEAASLDSVEHGKYPYWQTEFAYTYGEPPAGSLAAAFLTYLTEQGGRDVLRAYGSRLCAEVENPLVCEPT